MAAGTSVLELPSISALQSDSSHALSINVTAYAATGDGGGGLFRLDNSGSCAPDGGVVIFTSLGGHDCYYRQFSGPVHLPWYGVSDAADPSCYNNAACDASTALFNAFAASAQYGDGGVTTDGRSIALLTQCTSCIAPIPATAEIPKGQYLTCARPPGARHSWDDVDLDAYWRLPGSLVLNPAYTIFRDQSTLLSDCFIRPSWLYNENTSPVIPPASVADTVQMTHAFTGTATTCNKSNCDMSNVTIAGFDICDDTGGANKAVLSNVVQDCGTNEWVHAGGGGGPRLHGITADPLLEGSLSTDKQFVALDIVNVMQQSGTDNVVVRVDIGSGTNQLQLSGGDTVLITGLGASTASGSPVSANGRWLTSSVSLFSLTRYDVTLIGASWAGPTVTGSAWKAGAPVITVRDTTNIIPGQYVCASGTPPLCTPPGDFNFSSTTLGTAISSTTSLPQLAVGSTYHWPTTGLAQIGSTGMGTPEFVSYRVLDATDIKLTARGQHGTSGAMHSIGEPVTAAAPVVLSVPPPVVAAGPIMAGAVSEAVIISAPAQNTGSGSVTFANDPMLWLQPGTTSYGTLYLNPSYHTWTANLGAGGRPSSLVTDKADHASTDDPHDIKNFKDCWKAQPGMLINDVSDPTNTYFPSNARVTGCTGTTLTMDASIGSGITFTGGLIQLSGCGYPDIGTASAKPWLGNCAATALLLGGTGARADGTEVDDEVQGVLCDTIHTNSSEIAIHSLNAPATGCTNFIADESGGNGPQADADSAALWLDGPATKSQYSNGRLGGGANAILDTPGAGQVDGIGISNVQVGGNIALGANAKVTLMAAHGQTGAPAPTLFDSSGVILAQILGANLSQWSLVSDDPAALASLSCSGNIFATAPCAQVKGTPTCVSGCGSVTGSDSSFDVTVSSGATTIVVQLAGLYGATPICTLSPALTTLGAPVSSGISAVASQPWGTLLTLKTSSAVPHIYGACRGATG